MILRTPEQIQQLATLLLDALNSPVLRQPAKANIKAGLQQAWKCVCAKHETYAEIENNLPADKYSVQARAIAVLAVDWLHGDNTDWSRLIDNLLKQPAE